jgi:tryptophanyl-tRNA synthetase
MTGFSVARWISKTYTEGIARAARSVGATDSVGGSDDWIDCEACVEFVGGRNCGGMYADDCANACETESNTARSNTTRNPPKSPTIAGVQREAVFMIALGEKDREVRYKLAQNVQFLLFAFDEKSTKRLRLAVRTLMRTFRSGVVSLQCHYVDGARLYTALFLRTLLIMTEPNSPKRPIIFSAMQPTSGLTLGNYVGALKNWVEFQDHYDCIYGVVDLHALTVRLEPALLRKQTLDVAAMYVACGIDPERSVVFAQSHVPAHSQLAWVLNTFASMGECNKMTQFKEKSEKHSATVGLFTYPVLQAADILLYQANLVPVGEDQKQHLELSRNLAERFNHYYSDTFTVPEVFIPKVGARVMSLQDPTKKMSKSDDNPKATIFLTDAPDEVRNKIKRAVTDSGTDIRSGDERPAVTNLIELYGIATNETNEQIENRFVGKGYAEFKSALADALVGMLEPIHTRYNAIRNDKAALNAILKRGAEEANRRANRTLRKVYKKMGIIDVE